MGDEKPKGEPADKANGRNGRRFPAWLPWIIGIVFVSGGVFTWYKAAASEIPEIRKTVASHETEIQVTKTRVTTLETQFKDFSEDISEEQKAHGKILRRLEIGLLRGSGRRRLRQPEDGD